MEYRDPPDLRPDPPMFLGMCPFDPCGIHAWVEVYTKPTEPLRRQRCMTCGQANPPFPGSRPQPHAPE